MIEAGESGSVSTALGATACPSLNDEHPGRDVPCPRSVGTYLRRWGYTPETPSRRARRQDPDEVERWLLDTFPAIEAQAERKQAHIL